MKPLNFRDIPMFPRACWEVDVGWNHLESHIKSHTIVPEGMAPLDLEPDFQRAHVWTEAQQTAYVEYALRGGEVGRTLTFNCKGWQNSHVEEGPYVIIDGKQRLEAVRKFMRGELKAFGRYYPKDFAGSLRITHHGFKWRICALETRKEILEMYLAINAGGTPHTQAELDRVRDLLQKA